MRVAKAPPDGYQFVLGNSGTRAWSQSLYKKPTYDVIADLAPVSLVAEEPRAVSRSSLRKRMKQAMY